MNDWTITNGVGAAQLDALPVGSVVLASGRNRQTHYVRIEDPDESGGIWLGEWDDGCATFDSSGGIAPATLIADPRDRAEVRRLQAVIDALRDENERLRAFIRAFLDEEDEFPLTPEEHAAVASLAESLIGADPGTHTRRLVAEFCQAAGS